MLFRLRPFIMKWTPIKLGYVRITSFSMGTYKELLTALDSMEKDGMAGLVVDVRQNPGGILTGRWKFLIYSSKRVKTYSNRKKKIKKLKYIRQLTDVKLRFPFQF